MLLRSIALRDWKAYIQAKFEFPTPTRQKNVILIGAENGFGKTSFFEAVVLGLFGRDGLPLIARAPFGSLGEDRLAVSYREFMEGVLHAKALEEGRTSCSVQLVFEEDDGEPIEIRRVWSFASNGKFNNPYSNEDVQVFEGENRRPVGPSGLNGQDRLDWYRDYVASSFVPSTLAAFFMFDGERVSEFADKDMAVQVRAGIEGLLGIPVLRELADDLRTYASSKKVGGKTDDSLQRLEAEREIAKKELDEKRARITVLDDEISKVRIEQDKLMKELAGFGAGTQAQMQELVTRLGDHQREADRCEERLRTLISEDLSLAISGAGLRASTTAQIDREQTTENWQSGREQGSRNLSRFIDKFKTASAGIAPPIDPDHGDLFFPKPFNDEQVEIIRRLEKSDGLVVQGPPGTGKTHTIANIVSHMLATGRRVLVVSHGAISTERDLATSAVGFFERHTGEYVPDALVRS